MKRGVMLVLVLVALALVSSPSAFAGPSLGAGMGYSQNYVGEVDIYTTLSTWSPRPYSQVAPYAAGAAFSTFCIQQNENIWVNPYGSPGYPETYEVIRISDRIDHGEDNGPLLKAKAAQLFHLWNNRLLGNYSYAAGNQQTSQRAIDAKALQEALWYLQGYTANAGTGQRYADLVAGYTGGIGSVRVARLKDLSGRYSPPGSWAQDVLIETPEPGSMALLAIGALPVLPIVRRRRARV